MESVVQLLPFCLLYDFVELENYVLFRRVRQSLLVPTSILTRMFINKMKYKKISGESVNNF